MARPKKNPDPVATEEVTTAKKKERVLAPGGWNISGLTEATVNKEPDIIKATMYIEIQLLADAYGMMPPTKELLSEYIASRAPDAMTTKEEIEAYGEDAVKDKQTTIWPTTKFLLNGENDHLEDVFFDHVNDIPEVDENNLIWAPYLYNYQLRGMFKDACGLLSRAKNNVSSDTKSYKKIIDGNIFVFPRHVGIKMPDEYMDEFGNTVKTYDETGKLHILQRSLRVSGPQGERTAISSSEVLPAGSTLKFKVGMTSPQWKSAVEEWLDYGQVRGIGQWRNSSSGTFRWRELNSNWEPIE